MLTLTHLKQILQDLRTERLQLLSSNICLLNVRVLMTQSALITNHLGYLFLVQKELLYLYLLTMENFASVIHAYSIHYAFLHTMRGLLTSVEHILIFFVILTLHIHFCRRFRNL